MSSALPVVASVLQLFHLLFSDRWIRQWQNGWLRQQALVPPVQGTGARSKRKAPQKPKPNRSKPLSFYERIFTLRITLWYLLF